ncbi:MAG TPA: DUF4276 family protein [Planctomycetaceae bacterium]|nr:DUF4276 family protein [Planctomycetaceae bacterium]
MTIPQLRLLVEGDGDRLAVPLLVKKILKDIGASQHLVIQDEPMKIGAFHKLVGVKQDLSRWQNYLQAAVIKPQVVGCLTILDGDDHKFLHDGAAFCASRAAKILADSAAQVGAGTRFSTAIVIASQEFESWLIGAIGHLRGQSIDQRIAVPDDLVLPADPEIAPRNAKKWLSTNLGGYAPTRDQDVLTRALPLEAFRSSKMRSFRRLENAIQQLVEAARSGQHVVTPR